MGRLPTFHRSEWSPFFILQLSTKASRQKSLKSNKPHPPQDTSDPTKTKKNQRISSSQPRAQQSANKSSHANAPRHPLAKHEKLISDQQQPPLLSPARNNNPMHYLLCLSFSRLEREPLIIYPAARLAPDFRIDEPRAARQ